MSDQFSWSLVFIAGIAARMKRGETALKAIDTIARTCLMNNFFTVHNDWRRMGPITCADFRATPFQIDGNIGISEVINEMLYIATPIPAIATPGIFQPKPEIIIGLRITFSRFPRSCLFPSPNAQDITEVPPITKAVPTAINIKNTGVAGETAAIAGRAFLNTADYFF